MKRYTINPVIKQANSVMPDLIRHPVPAWIPAFAGMTTLGYLVAGVIVMPIRLNRDERRRKK